MSAAIMDGKAVSALVRREVKERAALLASKGVKPGLAVVLVGDDPASQVYVRQKEKACDEVGFASFMRYLPASTDERELLDLIDGLNSDPAVHGILVQLPLPKHIDKDRVAEAIRPEKDVDGFHPINVGRLTLGIETMEPCTPKGIVYLLEHYGIDIEGKRAVVVGRSNIVGKPVSLLLLSRNATVTVCHSRTKDLPDVTRQADILVAATGKPKTIGSSMVKGGAVVVDVGITRTQSGLIGDVDFDAVKEVASYITPVPGGIGPMTIAMLLLNALKAAEACASSSMRR
ncbi:MAG TPA: bifunctional methylenetetrahydrofolate dehydrogenase/methenyltetrahydrofolate cyclohydrolase FolD [Thermosynergistes sp.]|nr:bifunctional methylenetetrahydrofolate dehydrogenase/methenyltetrahydrofolate cyclohydrolase FolD [Thermosynergistes sp.]HQE21552.1 bifunctional methylenetetrahydrofolate dehydrogenase/methenyltetrahydrofolate cyclohydrolase FolD [Thermosynergistes sp.]